MAARVHQINVNPEGGVPKHRVASTRLLREGVEGDKHRDLRFHGGPARAVCLYSLERLNALAEEGHPARPGSIGENLTIEGLEWGAVRPGMRFEVGEALIEITSETIPCKNIGGSFAGGDFTRVSAKKHPGWSRLYASVLREGLVREGDPVHEVHEA
ncbi:MAG TPA: MOSC domain-containing protein [Myxococcaceae bacterium]|nr:MOSC domain-containing protein [Myxococcaceae bacterium]